MERVTPAAAGDTGPPGGSLEEFLLATADIPASAEEAEKRGWKILSMDEANGVLRHIAAIEREIAAAEAAAQKEIERVQAWLDGRRQTLAGRKAWLEAALISFHQALLAEDPHRKTVKLPCGELQSRLEGPKWEYDDEALLRSLLAVRPDLVKHRPVADKAGLKASLQVVWGEDGQGVVVDPVSGAVVEGARVRPGERVFRVRPAGDGE